MVSANKESFLKDQLLRFADHKEEGIELIRKVTMGEYGNYRNNPSYGV